MKSRGPTRTQLVVLRRMTETDAILERRPGGFWTTYGTPDRIANESDFPFGPRRVDRVPCWYVMAQTVESMEKRGYIRLIGIVPEGGSWYDQRELTDEGRRLVLSSM